MRTTQKKPSTTKRTKPQAAPKKNASKKPNANADEKYEKYKTGQADIMREQSRAGREIGAIPEIANLKRREKCAKSLRAFLETYLCDVFKLDWSPDHLDEIKRIEEAVRLGAMYALADPRGDGKTSRTRGAALWAVANGYRRYAFLIGSNESKAEEAIDTLKVWIRMLPKFAADYPEISHPAQALQGIANRASGQTCEGESTFIVWSQSRVILPTVPCPENWPKKWKRRSDGKAPTSGAILGCSGLTGEGIRGSTAVLTTGELVRPDIVLLDDPQTDDSAKSVTQNASRLKLISSAILGLAGPGEKLSAIMPCTVIERGDAIDQILDRKKHPLWRGTRRGILRTMPANLKAWDAYFEIYDACALAEPPDFERANEYYRAHRDTLDAGAEASWEARKEEGEVSAIQHAMALYHRDAVAFWSEYMNAPLDIEAISTVKKLDRNLLATRLNRLPVCHVSPAATRLTAGIDVGGEILWYCVSWWDERFNGGVCDYGWWPTQPRPYFPADNPPHKLSDLYPGQSEEQRIYSGLRDLSTMLLAARYHRADSGDQISIDRCLVDEGFLAPTVYQFARESPHASIITPSKGFVPRSPTTSPMSGWQTRAGERASKAGQPSWKQTSVAGKGRHVIFEANEWKSHVAERLLVPPGGGGALQLYGDVGQNHAMLVDHLTSEYATRVTMGGRAFDRWAVKPARSDNHLWDCLTLTAVAAGIQGLEFRADASSTPGPSPTKTETRKWSEIQRNKMAERARSGAT